jgi:hypothetical protein
VDRCLEVFEIPVNREVKYDTPKPAVPLEKLEFLPGLRGGEP